MNRAKVGTNTAKTEAPEGTINRMKVNRWVPDLHNQKQAIATLKIHHARRYLADTASRAPHCGHWVPS